MNDQANLFSALEKPIKERFLKESGACADDADRFVADLVALRRELFNPATPGALRPRKDAIKNVPSALRKAARLLQNVDYETWAFAKYFGAQDADGFVPWTEASNDLKSFCEPSRDEEVKRLSELAALMEKALANIPATKSPKLAELVVNAIAATFKNYSLSYVASANSFAADCFHYLAETSCYSGLTNISNPTHWLKKALNGSANG